MIYQLNADLSLERAGDAVRVHTSYDDQPVIVPLAQLRLALGFMEQEAVQAARAEAEPLQLTDSQRRNIERYVPQLEALEHGGIARLKLP